MNTPSVFRKISIDRLSSPDELDRLLRVTGPRAWIALAALATLVVSALVWSVVATVPSKVSGRGILLKSGGILEVAPNASGRLIDLAVGVGDAVSEGAVVARIAQPDLADKLQQAKISLANLRQAHEFLLSYGQKEVDVQLAALDRQQKHLEESIASAAESIGWFREKIATQEDLVGQGRLVKQTLINTRQQLEAIDERVRADRNQLADLGVKRLQLTGARERDVQNSLFKVREAETEIAQLERDLAAATEVRSPYTGRILEVTAEQGSIVTRGEPLLTLDLTGRTVTDLEAVLYVPPQDGKRIKPGMTVQIAPVTVKPEEYGYMMGKVTHVSDLPSTARGMERVLKNKDLTAMLSGGAPPHEVLVDLLPDQTFSGYRWTSKGGPPTRVQSGTLCSAGITFATRRPIQLVIPFVR